MSSFHRNAWKAVANYVACTKRAKLYYFFGQVILAHYVQPQESVFWQEVCSCPSTVECPPRVNPQIRDNKNRSGMSPGKAKVRKLLSCEGEEGRGYFFIMSLLGPRKLPYQVDSTLVFLFVGIFYALHQVHWVRPAVGEHDEGVGLCLSTSEILSLANLHIPCKTPSLDHFW